MTLPLDAGTWNLDPAHSVVGFSVGHLGISLIRGRFVDVTAGLVVGDDLASSSLQAEIDMSSIDTGNADRDGHVKGSDFFSVETHPKMAFASSSIAANGDSYQIAGDLTINGQTRAVALDVAFRGVESNPFDGSVRGGFAATTTIDRADFGIDWQVPLTSGGVMLARQVDIVIDAQLVGPTPAEG